MSPPTQVQAPETLPSYLSGALELVGLRWPDGNASQLWAAGDAWIAAARSLREAMTSGSTGGDAVAARVWTANQGQAIDQIRQWWTWDRGPSANLARAVTSFEQIGASLQGMSVQVASLKALYIANLAALVAAFAAAGIAIAGSLGLGAALAAAGSAAAIMITRRAMVRALQRAIAVVAGTLVGVLLFRAVQQLQPAPPETTTRRDRRTQPDRDPPPFPPLWPPNPTRDRQPRCEQRPDALTPTITGMPPNSQEALYAGTGLQRIDKQVLPDGSRQILIEGVIRDPIPRSGFERQLAGLDASLGVPAGQYQASHTWGPRFGSEAAAGIYLSPREVNLGFQWQAESYLQGLHQTTPPDGWVELRAVTTTHPTSVFGNTGANFTAATDYEATVCRPGRIIETHRFGFEVGQPTVQGGTFQPGRVTIYGMP